MVSCQNRLHAKTFIARATSGASTAAAVVEVHAAEVPRFVENETGVVERTAGRLVVRCTATGKPTPAIGFTNHTLWGTNLIEQFSYNDDVTDTGASITMTILPKYAEFIRAICCVARLSDTGRLSALIVLSENTVDKTEENRNLMPCPGERPEWM